MKFLRPSKFFLVILCLSFSPTLQAKEIALTFDDAPVGSTLHFDSLVRTETLIKKLKKLKVPQVMVFANPCKGSDPVSTISQLKKYQDAGHMIGNHTCTHPRLDNVGFDTFSKDVEKADTLLQPLFSGQKYFRFPFLNEGKKAKAQKQMRKWLESKNYRNAYVSVDNDDTVLTEKINAARKLGKPIDYKAIEPLFVKHILTAAEFYDDLAKKHLGYSPKHVLLLHEIDGTVLFLEGVVSALRENGWKIIGAEEAYTDPLYFKNPTSTDSGNGILAQIAHEKIGQKIIKGFYTWDKLSLDLNKALGLDSGLGDQPLHIEAQLWIAPSSEWISTYE